MKDKYFPSVILAIIGLAFLLFGGLFGMLIPTGIVDDAKRLESMEPVSVSALKDSQPGREVLVEGKISPDNIAAQGKLVSYMIEHKEYDAQDQEYNWVERGRNTPSLAIDTPTGTIRVENEDYLLIGNLSVEESGSTRYRGLELNSPVIVVGVLQTVSDGIPYLQAEQLAVGSQAEAVADQYAGVLAMRIIGGVFGIIGLGLLLGAAILAVTLR